MAGTNPVQAIGIAYLLTPHDYIHVIASEGGGIAYKETEVVVEGVDEVDKIKLGAGKGVVARTLTTVEEMKRRPVGAVSERYMVRLLFIHSITFSLPFLFSHFVAR